MVFEVILDLLSGLLNNIESNVSALSAESVDNADDDVSEFEVPTIPTVSFTVPLDTGSSTFSNVLHGSIA